MALRGCNKCLKHVRLESNEMGDEQLVNVIEALTENPQLESLELLETNVGRLECGALKTLLRCINTELQELTLSNTEIDDEGVDTLTGALANNGRLRTLNLSSNHNITGRGWQSLATLLENPNANLENLDLVSNNVGDEGVLIFANALASNRKLKTLDLSDNGITTEGWSSFSKNLCDTSSVNNTYLSNHTLGSLGVWETNNMPPELRSLLALNSSSDDKRQVAMKKILKHHRHFDMQPFFEWELKVLPIAINWFDRARSVDSNNVAEIDKHELEAIYQFIHAMPEVFEPTPAAARGKRKKIGC